MIRAISKFTGGSPYSLAAKNYIALEVRINSWLALLQCQKSWVSYNIVLKETIKSFDKITVQVLENHLTWMILRKHWRNSLGLIVDFSIAPWISFEECRVIQFQYPRASFELCTRKLKFDSLFFTIIICAEFIFYYITAVTWYL